jgi:DEAD/DEAH box helicase domain-containing protein
VTRVLLPDLINFAYIPHNERRVHDGSAGSSSKRAKSPDFSAFAKKAEQFRTQLEPEEHVLTLEFNESSKSKKEIDPSVDTASNGL